MQVTDGKDPATHDVVVVDGGVAGLSGALTLGRARRSVLIVDSREPRNAPASGVHGLLSRDGTTPEALLRAGRAEARRYGAGARRTRRLCCVRRWRLHRGVGEWPPGRR